MGEMDKDHLFYETEDFDAVKAQEVPSTIESSGMDVYWEDTLPQDQYIA